MDSLNRRAKKEVNDYFMTRKLEIIDSAECHILRLAAEGEQQAVFTFEDNGVGRELAEHLYFYFMDEDMETFFFYPENKVFVEW